MCIGYIVILMSANFPILKLRDCGVRWNCLRLDETKSLHGCYALALLNLQICSYYQFILKLPVCTMCVANFWPHTVALADLAAETMGQTRLFPSPPLPSLPSPPLPPLLFSPSLFLFLFSPPLPLPYLSYSSLSPFSLSIVPSPPSFRSLPLPSPLVQLGSLGERCKLPSEVRGAAPAADALFTILTPGNTSGDTRFTNPTCILPWCVL